MPKVVSRQLINVVVNNRARFDPEFFGKGQAVLLTERLTYDDGTKVKRGIIKENPTVQYYVTAEGYRENHVRPETFFPSAQCDLLESPVENLDRDCAHETGQMAYYRETAGPGSSMRRRKIHDHRWLHGSDVNLADHYMDRWMEAYKDVVDVTSPLEMSFADIEVDPIDYEGFPDEFLAPCPVTMISNFHRPTGRLTQFLCRRMCRPNPQVAEFEGKRKDMARWIVAECNRAPLEAAGLVPKESPWEAVEEYCLANPAEARVKAHEFRFFDTEKELILGFLDHVNNLERPDVISWWNMSFDVNTMIGRLRANEVDPQRAFTPEVFSKWPYADYRADTFKTQETDRGDIFGCASTTIWIDGMLLYASLRKQAGKKESYGLDFTLKEEIKEQKLTLEHGIRDQPYKDYARFVLYSALDVVPMATLEEKTGDIDLAYRLSLLTRTRIHKVMKKTVCLRNLANVFLQERGLAISNNRNRNKERTEEEKFQGGWVASPHFMANAGAVIGGMPSNRVFEWVVDMDATSLYPSIILLCNVDAAGQVGRLVLLGPNGEQLESSVFVEAVCAGDFVDMGKRFFGLPGLSELAYLVTGDEGYKPRGSAEVVEHDPEEGEGEEEELEEVE